MSLPSRLYEYYLLNSEYYELDNKEGRAHTVTIQKLAHWLTGGMPE
jgi:hypothetical protein